MWTKSTSIPHLILASGSPRRQELMKLLDVPFVVRVPDIEEILDDTLSLAEAAMSLARQKAEAIDEKRAWVLGCDTIVEVNGHRLGKPVDAADAARMLALLGGTTHRVMTGCCLKQDETYHLFHQSATVTFAPLEDAEIAEYIGTGEPFGKAGAYAIQGYAARFITSIAGDYYAIMGLPVRALYQHLKELLR
ncbi:MAG: septum formation protein Maf [Acholeplasmatales bacterium]|nr:MAG: septum formation protein Maf [Acholeplasmatales bacterium]